MMTTLPASWEALTTRQREFAEYLLLTVTTTQHWATTREAMHAMGFHSTEAISGYYRALLKKGVLLQTSHKGRSRYRFAGLTLEPVTENATHATTLDR